MKLTPTKEQKKIIDGCLKEKASRIFAFAGAGKTATLKMIADSSKVLLGNKCQGLYLAFNKSVASYAQKLFPPHIDCRTMHSLAFKGCPDWLKSKLRSAYMPLADYQSHYQTGDYEAVTNEGKLIELTSIDIGRIIVNSVKGFCRSNNDKILNYHVRLNPILDRAKNEHLINGLLKPIARHWEDCVSPEYQFGINHDIYLKYYSLTNPKLETDFILFDEAQDADPVMRSIIEQQKEHSKIVTVGDPHQQIYSWRGSQDAMHIMDGKKFYLTKTFRFGKEIANLANALLRKLGEPKKIVDNGSEGNIEWSIPFNCENGGILCRTNKAAFKKYIGMYETHDDVSLNINHDEIESFLNGAEKLINGRRAYSPEMLSLFRTWGEVVDYANTGAGTDIAYIVNLIEGLGVPTLKTALRLSRKKNAALTISTIHKAKGLEWDNVAIDQDFSFTRNKKKQIELDDEEKRLLYVACTRAKINLNVSEIAENLREFIGRKLISPKKGANNS